MPASGWFGQRWRARRKRLLQLWAIGIGASVAVTIISATGYLEPSQAKALDFLMQLRGQRLVSDVVIVAIDDKAFESFGQRQPIPRDYLARVLRGLRRSGAAVVGLDIAFTAPTAAAEDGALVRAVADFGEGGARRVVLTAVLPSSGPLAEPAFGDLVAHGDPRVAQDSDGVVRQAALLLPKDGSGHVPAFALVIAARLQGIEPDRLAAALGGARPGELTRINYVGPAKTFLTIPSDVVVTLGDGADPATENPLRGRVVLVGATFQESRDFFQTPHGLMPGVEVHASIVHMILTESFIRPSGWALSLALQIALVLVAGTIMVTVRSAARGYTVFGATVALAFPASYLAFERGGYWVDFVLPVVATQLLGTVAAKLDARRFREAFGRYVSSDVAAQVLAQAPSLEGERREVSVLFSDLRGFTTISETMAPDKVAAHLTEYFDAMTAAIFRHRGMVNDFIGDAVMAIFGAPLADPDHALHAVKAAADMERALAGLNERWKAVGLPVLRMGIGVHTGEVFAGNVGGRARMKYTIVGDPVNVASRVEGLNKETGTTVLITEATRVLLGDRIDVRDCGAIPVKGRNEPVRVWELLAVRSDGGAPEKGEST